MPEIFEVHRANFTISADPVHLDVDAIDDMIARAYWAHGRTRAMISRYLQHSLTFGLYDGSRQFGLARVVSDYTTFSWLCDVFIHEDYRGQGLGKWLMEAVHSHPDLQELRLGCVPRAMNTTCTANSTGFRLITPNTGW